MKSKKIEILWKGLPWSFLPCLKAELRLDITLKCGQSFRWTEDSSGETWTGPWRNQVWLLKQDSKAIYFKTHPYLKDKEGEYIQLLNDYFQLNRVHLEPLYKEWSKSDEQFNEVAKDYPGVRMLRQDPLENLFSFICSANNNIKRISSMVEHLCITYGTYLGTIKDRDIHSFPTLAQLNQDKNLENNLRENGFGYRAGYIVKTAKELQKKGGEEFLLGLRDVTYEEAKESLVQLPGIGPKVADCILLMSMDKTEAIPVDTHMFQIAARSYMPHLVGKKSVTSKVYQEIGDHFRSLYGSHAGWAHSVLFSSDLRHLKEKRSVKNKEEPPSKKTKKKP